MPKRPSSAVGSLRLVVVGLFVALTVSVVGGVSPTAQASTGGSATAQAVDIELLATPVTTAVSLTSPTSTAPATNGTDTDDLAGLTAVGITIGAITQSATRGPTSTSATTAVTDASIDLLGLPLLRTGVITATVNCPFPSLGTPSAGATAAGVSVLGTGLIVTEAGATVGPVDAGVASIEATIQEIEDPGVASSIVLTATVTPLLGTPVTAVDVVLAHAECVVPTGLDAPTANSLVPTLGPQAGGNTVRVNGAGMLPGTTTILVTFPGGTTATVPAGSVTVGGAGTTATFTMPASPLAGAGTVQADNAGSASAALPYTFIPPPTTTGITPAQGSAAGGTSVTITGAGFVVGDTTVEIGGAPATGVTVLDANTLTATTPAGAVGPQAVVVSTTTGGASTTPLTFTYLAPPTATGIVPPYGPVAGQLVTVTGTELIAGTFATVAIPGGPPVTVPAAAITLGGGGTTATFTMPNGITPGAATVVLTNDGGSTAPLAFQYLGVPTATSLAPPSGPLLTPITVTITGTDFPVGGTEVLITLPGAGTPTVIPAASVTVGGGGTTATFATPVPASPGAAAVAVRTPAGTSTPDLTFTYLPVPTAASLSPDRGRQIGGDTVTITGADFVPGSTSVTIDGTTVPAIVAAGGTSLTFVTPGHVPGPVLVTVTTPGGTSTPGLTFTYLPTPTTGGINPSFGPVAGGTTVTINGADFLPGETSVTILMPDSSTVTVAAADVTVNGPGTSLTFTMPAGVAGLAAVTVTTPGGTSTPAEDYDYLPPPTATSVTPDSGPLTAGNVVTVAGSGFIDGIVTVTVTPPGQAPVVIDPLTITFAPDGTTMVFAMPASTTPGTATIAVTSPVGNTAPLPYEYLPVPTAATLTPGSGPQGGGNTITITGTGFVPGATTVTIGGITVPAGSVNVAVGGTSLTFAAPAAAVPGPVTATVTTLGGTSAGPGLPYTYLPAPTATSIDPVSGPIAGGNTATVTGTGFVPGETTVVVTLPNGTVLAPVTPTAVTATTVEFTLPNGVTPGTATVAIVTNGGTAGIPYQYLPVPAIASLAPNAGPIAGGTPVTITGTGFVPGATTVSVDGGAPITPTAVTATSLTFTTPAHAAGGVPVTVSTAGGTSPAQTFTYLPVPTATSLTPSSGPEAGGNTVTITGTGFVVGATEVLIAGAPITTTITVAGDTSLQFVVPPGTPGGVLVQVRTAGGTSAAPGLPYTYLPAPTASSIDPVAGPVLGGNTATVTGTNFQPGATTVVVTLPGGTVLPPITPTTVTPTTVVFTVPAGTLGTATVAVVTDGGSASVPYDYLPVPAIGSLTPNAGPIAGGTVVTVTGSGFVTGATTVSVDGGAPVTPTAVTATSLTFTTPAHAAGGVPVTVTTLGGTSPAQTFTYYAVPTATSLTPAEGPQAGGTVVTVAGTGFAAGVTEVSIGGTIVPAMAVTVTGPTSLTFTTPGGSPGPVNVVVQTPGGASAPLPFEYLPAPTGVVDPAVGPLAGGNAVTITGANLDDGTVVTVTLPNGTVVTVTPTVLTATAITFTMPASPTAGPAVITVTTGGGELDIGYQYQPVPTATGVDPAIGPLAGGNQVTVSGTGFVPGATTIEVTLPDGTTVIVPAALVVVSGDGTTASFPMPPSTGPGDATIAVVTTGGESAPVAYEYAPVPTAVRLEPDAFGPVAGGNQVTVIGTGFVPGQTSIVIGGIVIPAAAVTVGVAPAASFGASRSSTAQLVPLIAPMAVATGTAATFVAPPGALGPVSVFVVTPGGTIAPALTYTYVPNPLTVSGVVPPAGPLTGGNQVVITGTGFVPGHTTVTITQPGSGTVTVPASAVTVNAAGTTASFTMPAGVLPGDATLTVAVNGQAGPSIAYRYVVGPTATGLSPSSGPPAGGTIVTITGSGMIPGATQVVVTLPNGTVVTIPADQLGIRTDGTALNVRMPPSPRCGNASVRLVTAGGSSATLTYRYAGAGCSLPATGSSSGWSLSLAVVLVAAGSALVVSGRRRACRAA